MFAENNHVVSVSERNAFFKTIKIYLISETSVELLCIVKFWIKLTLSFVGCTVKTIISISCIGGRKMRTFLSGKCKKKKNSIENKRRKIKSVMQWCSVDHAVPCPTQILIHTRPKQSCPANESPSGDERVRGSVLSPSIKLVTGLWMSK